MEGIGEFFNNVLRVLHIVLTIGLFCIAGYLHEQNKVLERELLECTIELKIIKE
jgi:hypothetical protein